MTDWIQDLKDLAAMYEHPDKETEETASPFLIGFLYHVVPHLTEAGRLLLDEVPNPFSSAASGERQKGTF
jgi:hypothetical protein